MFDFNDDLRFARDVEMCVADDLVAVGYEVELVENMDAQYDGIDLDTIAPGGQRVLFQVKGDRRAKDTGNFFLEYMSNCEAGIESGPMHCQADYYAIYITNGELIYVSVETMRRNFKRWAQQYPHRYTGWNKGRHGKYRGRGILVPLDEIRRVARKTKAKECARC